MKYLKLTENQKQIIEFKNAQNSAVNVPIMLIEDGYYVAHDTAWCEDVRGLSTGTLRM